MVKTEFKALKQTSSMNTEVKDGNRRASEPRYSSSFDETKITVKKYKVHDRYIAERENLHYDIIYMILDKRKPGSEPIAILLGGGSGAGKSTVVSKFLQVDDLSASEEFVYINSDEIKTVLPEYDEYKETDIEFAAFYVHEESTDIANILLDHCINHKYSFIYDGTMSWQPHYVELIERLEKNQFIIQGIFVDIEVEEAIRRAKIRATAEGRHVQEDIIRQSNYNAPITFLALQAYFSHTIIFNNNLENHVPEIIFRKEHNVVEICNGPLYYNFLMKAEKPHKYD